jgi:lipoprotein NlpI
MSDTDLFHPVPGQSNNPAFALAFYMRGNDWADAGNLDSAIADYNAALTINPMFAAAHADRGIAWARKGDFDRAIADFDTALRINPHDEKTRKNRAIVLDRMYESEDGPAN